jgi:hypothetical protein
MLLLGEDRSAGRTLRGVGKDAETTRGHLGRLAAAASVAVVGGFVAAGAAAVKFTQQAADDQIAATKLATVMHNAAGATHAQVAATEDWISAQGKAKGIADDDLRPALMKLVSVTHDVSKAQSLASLAMDVSAGTGRSYQSVVDALVRAQAGSVTGLSRLGIATKDAHGKTLSLQQVTENLARTYSGAASTAAETTAGKQQRLKVALSETGEAIGYKLLPFMLSLTTAATDALDWMTEHATLMRDIGVAVGIAGASLLVFKAATTAASVVGGIHSAVLAAQAVAAGTATEAQIALNAAMRANVIGIVITVLAALVGALILAYKHSETFRDIVNGAWHAIGTAARAVWNNFLAPVFEFYGRAIGTVLSTWAALLHMLGHVPGFGWAKDLADKLDTAADKAKNLDLKLDAATQDRDVRIRIHPDNLIIKRGPGGLPLYNVQSSNAVGTQFFAGGLTRVGERGPEYVVLPRGSQVYTAEETARMAGGSGDDLGTLTVVIATDTGEVIERKLARLKRTRGGARLAFA